MSASLAPADLVDLVSVSSRQQRVLRALVVVAAGAFLALVPAAGGGGHPWLSAAGVLLALVAAAAPESHAPLGLLLFLCGFWYVAVPDRLGAVTVGAAVALLVVHVAATLTAHGPPGVTLERSLLRTWGLRTLLCAASAAGLWLAGRAAASAHGPASAMAVALALLVVLGWCLLVAARIAGTRRGQGGRRGA